MARLSEHTPYLHPEAVVTDTRMGRYVEIGHGACVTHSEIGDYSFCERYADIANAQVGKFSNISSFVRIGGTDHPMEKASLHHFHYRSSSYFDDAEPDEAWLAHRRTRRTVIGHDTWLGNGAQVRPDITIGHGAVIAGGAIVTKDIAPYMIVAGIPAAPLRARYPDKIAERMMLLAWWDWPHDQLRAALHDFRTLKAEPFLDRYEP